MLGQKAWGKKKIINSYYLTKLEGEIVVMFRTTLFT